jgi:hypothetical protein
MYRENLIEKLIARRERLGIEEGSMGDRRLARKAKGLAAAADRGARFTSKAAGGFFRSRQPTGVRDDQRDVSLRQLAKVGGILTTSGKDEEGNPVQASHPSAERTLPNQRGSEGFSTDPIGRHVSRVATDVARGKTTPEAGERAVAGMKINYQRQLATQRKFDHPDRRFRPGSIR